MRNLTLAWSFQTGQSQQIKASPILVDGVIYITTPDNIWAIDARSARQLWRYTYPTNQGFHIGHRGAAVHKNTVYLTTPDAHLVALDARTGTVKWNVEIADAKRGFWSTNAPLVIRNHVLVGVSGDFDNLPGMLQSFDPEVGAHQWTFYSTPPAGSPDSTERRRHRRADVDDRHLRSRAQSAVRRHRQSDAGAERRRRVPATTPGPAASSRWIPTPGSSRGAFRPRRTTRTTGTRPRCRSSSTRPFNGAPRKLLMQASRNGYFFVLDRTTGKNLLTKPFAAVNWAKGIDADGRPIPDPAKEPSRDGVLIAPNESGATNYRSPSFDAKTGVLIVSAQDSYGIYFFKPEHGTYGWAGADYNLYGRSWLRAIDYQTGTIRWSHDLGDGASGAGVLTTESGLTFTGDTAGNALALRTSDGATLWHAGIGKVGTPPVTYELDGRQYMLIGGGSALYAWALPARN